VLNDNAVLAKGIPAGSGNVEISKNTLAAKNFSQYVNMIMTAGKDRLDEKDREQAESTFITLFEFLKSKRDFLEQYRNGLARRLLRNETVGADIEAAFLDKLKKGRTEESLSFATNMLSDMAKRIEFASAFADFVKNRTGDSKCPVEPLLCSAAWPIKTVSQSYRLPDKMENYVRLFEQFFISTTSAQGKKTISILNQYGNGDVSFYSAGRKYELHGTQIHLVVLPDQK